MTKLEIEKLRTKVRRANSRLRALENAGLEETSNAYELVRTVFRRDTLTGENTEAKLVQGGEGYEKLRFRSDISTIARTDENAFKVLREQVNIFLDSADATPRDIYRSHELQQKRYEETLKAIQERHGVTREGAIRINAIGETALEARTNKAFETFNANRVERGKEEISRETYDFIFTNAYSEYLSKRFSSSDEWVDVSIASVEHEVEADLVIDYLNKIPESEFAIAAEAMIWGRTGTPTERFERRPEGFTL